MTRVGELVDDHDAGVALLEGHEMSICLPTNASEERRQLLKAYGANLINVDGGHGSNHGSFT